MLGPEPISVKVECPALTSKAECEKITVDSASIALPLDTGDGRWSKEWRHWEPRGSEKREPDNARRERVGRTVLVRLYAEREELALVQVKNCASEETFRVLTEDQRELTVRKADCWSPRVRSSV